MYRLIRPFLFSRDPEEAHHLALSLLRYLPAACFAKPKTKPVSALGLDFRHPIGLAAGFDKNGEYLDALTKLGFSFIEVGTVTPRPQLGNPKPRLFRLPKAKAIINRMGFNNLGIDALLANIQKAEFRGILGINIGKNRDTPIEKATEDYLFCLRKAYLHASYVTINISSPNTPGLRQLQSGDYFRDLMNLLKEEQRQLADTHQRYVPLLIKLSPEETDEALKRMGEESLKRGIDGLIATNTTTDHSAVLDLPEGKEEGGLSGPPLAKRATHCLKILKQVVGDELTLIGVGGIDSVEAAKEKLQAGASLLQVYTGLIYQGPALLSKLIKQEKI